MRAWLLPFAACVAACGGDPAPRADLVLRGGIVRSMVLPSAGATAIAVAGDSVLFVGTDSAAGAWIGPGTRVIELGGRAVLPGFRDVHVHPAKGGLALGALDLTDAATATQALDLIRRYAAEHPDRAWITGRGWALPLFPDANPGREPLDSLVPDRPVYLVAQDGHSAWVNAAALRAGGVTAGTPDPPGGRIERDATGRPAGTLRESAMALVERFVPPPSAEELERALEGTLERAARLGITALHDAGASAAFLGAYEALARRGALTVRVSIALTLDPDTIGPDPTAVQALPDPALPLLRVTAYKLLLDGVIEAHTAALLVPYVDPPRDRGPTRIFRERLFPLVASLDRAGARLHFHAIGDRAVRDALDAVAHADAVNGPRDRRPLIAHLQLIHPDDLPRFAALGVVAVVQPLWAYRDRYITDLTEPRVGTERSRRLYPFGSLARAGASLAGGSDWPVTSLDPWRAIEVAVTRREPGAPAGAPWLPDQALDLWTALAAYTVGGAAALAEAPRAGTLVAGAPADLMVVDRDPFGVPPRELHALRVHLTVVAGRIVFADPDANRRIP